MAAWLNSNRNHETGRGKDSAVVRGMPDETGKDVDDSGIDSALLDDDPKLTTDSCRSVTAVLWGDEDRAIEADLVNLVANAHYDVTRYPGHVALCTNGAGHHTSKQKRRFLAGTMKGLSFTRFEWILRCILAVLMTAAIPASAMLFRTPEDCQVMDVVGSVLDFDGKDIKAPNTTGYLSDLSIIEIYEQGRLHDAEFICHLQERYYFVIAISFSMCLLAPAFYGAMTILLSLTLPCTSKVYSLYVRFTLGWFWHLHPYVAPILKNYTSKPENCQLVDGVFGTIGRVWKRLFFLPYMVCIWFFCIATFFFLGSAFMGEITWGGLTTLFVWQVYFPAIGRVLGARDILQNVIKTELRNTTLLQDSKRTSDVWERLLGCSTSSFCCTSEELDLILQYFKASHVGIRQGSDNVRARWPIWWHDHLELTGNTPINAVYLEDFDLVISKAGLNAKTTPEIAEYLRDRHSEIAKMRSEKE